MVVYGIGAGNNEMAITVTEGCKVFSCVYVIKSVFRILTRIGSGFNQVSGSGFGIRIQEGKNTKGLKASLVAWTSFKEANQGIRKL
jgi:hypothetical protein